MYFKIRIQLLIITLLLFTNVKASQYTVSIPHVQKLSLDTMIPPMGQAALGIEIVKGNDKLKEISDFLNDEDTYLCTMIERDFISAIEAGCSAPVACNATIEDEKVKLRVMLGYPDGSKVMKKEEITDKANAKELGKKLAKDMIEEGAIEFLEEAQKLAFKEEMPQRL